jgi:two-component system KDP operon response regulator KdpE
MKPFIVLVDDDRQVVRFLKQALEESGYAVAATSSGSQALALLKVRMPDLLILDLNMPEPDGIDLLRIERTQFPYLRVLVISGYLKGEQLEAMRFVGAFGTLEKPFTAKAVVSKVREMIGEAQKPAAQSPKKRARANRGEA